MFGADNVKEAVKELVELTEAKAITEEGQQASFASIQDLYKERVVNLCDLLGLEKLYLTNRVAKQTESVKKQTDWLEQRSKQLQSMPQVEMIRYLVYLELAMNQFVHIDDDDLYGAVCNTYYGEVHQDAIDLFEQFKNFKEE